jgi:glycosyltransferase involved in cell wall biosynthesis
MISIVICSIKESYLASLEINIKETIGDNDYEIIKIDNIIEKLSITQAYNRGIEKSKFDYLLFIHEDILFHTANWGQILLSIFRANSQIGLIGIAGAKYKSLLPSAFWHTTEEMLDINLIQHYKHKKPGLFKKGFKNENLEKAVVIDGVFIGLRKSMGVRFNENIKGFHCYDLGISIDTLEQHYEIYVTSQILIEHFSIGNTDLDFIKGVIHFHELYKNKLPKYINSKNPLLETVALNFFLSVCLENRFVPLKLWLYSFFIYNPFDKLNYRMIKVMLNIKK